MIRTIIRAAKRVGDGFDTCMCLHNEHKMWDEAMDCAASMGWDGAILEVMGDGWPDVKPVLPETFETIDAFNARPHD